MQPVRIGISEFAEFSVNLPVIPATVRVLEQTLGRDAVSVRTYSVAALHQAARRGEVDVILSSAGTYRRLAIEGVGVRDLATVVSHRAPNPNYADGSVFFVRADRKDTDDIRSIADLKGRSIAATHRLAFSGWQTAIEELHRRKLPDGERFFGSVAFKGHDMPLVVEAVDAGEVEAGIVRACFLEDIGVPLGNYRILDPMPEDGRINCVRSTALYPNWTVSTLPSTPPETSRRVAAALLAMPPGENGLHWSIATDFRGIDALFLDLRIGPYAYLRQFSFARFVREHSLAFTAALTLILALLLHSVTVSAIVRRRTHDLHAALERQKELERESHDAAERAAALQRIGIVGQMSSMIAHELRQPLAGVSLYAFGLLRRFENGTDRRGTTIEGLERICEQNRRASAIVDQVRAYARGERERSPLHLAPLLERIVTELRKTSRLSNVHLELETAPGDPLVLAQPLEIELIVGNLVRNAVDAVNAPGGRPAGREPLVRIRLEAADGNARLSVLDNGPEISDGAFGSILTQTARTTKETGLGLGLSIVRSLVEDMNGRLEFQRPEGGGLLAAVVLPLLVNSTLRTESGS